MRHKVKATALVVENNGLALNWRYLCVRGGHEKPRGFEIETLCQTENAGSPLPTDAYFWAISCVLPQFYASAARFLYFARC